MGETIIIGDVNRSLILFDKTSGRDSLGEKVGREL